MNIFSKQFLTQKSSRILNISTGNPASTTNGISLKEITLYGDNQDGQLCGDFVAENLYKINLKINGLNLVDYTKATDRLGNPITIIENGVIWDRTINYYFNIPCELKSGTTISAKCNSDYAENEGHYISSYNTLYTDKTQGYFNVDSGYITITKDMTHLQLRKENPASSISPVPIKVTDIMCVKGKYSPYTIPDYEPYQAPQSFDIFLPKQIGTDEFATISFNTGKATLVSGSETTDISNLQNWSKIPKLKNTNIITAKAEITPSDMEITYYSRGD